MKSYLSGLTTGVVTLITLGGLCLTTYARPAAPLQVPPTLKCYTVRHAPCLDCPSEMSHYCAVDAQGQFKTCVAAEPSGCEGGNCDQVTAGTGTGCP